MDTEESTSEDSPVESMLHSIIACKDVFYKSQQKDEPELTAEEKFQILKDLLNRSKATFLQRYGKYLTQAHVHLFNPNEDYEIEHYLKEIQYRLDNHQNIVRNRRLTALKSMIEEGEYFSETQMMQREPTLYQNLVGQYMTQEEKRLRDLDECPGDSLVNIILQGIDRDELDATQRRDKERDDIEEFDTDDDSDNEVNGGGDSKMMINGDSSSEDVDYSKAPRWGGFDKDERLQFPVATTNLNRDREEATVIMAPEKALLRDEFTGIMYSNFLAGKDKDFDYSTVDDNTRYDDETLRSRDLEDKYFDSEEPEEVDMTAKDDKMSESSAEDALDVFMSHLNENIHRRDVDDMSLQLETMKGE